MSDTQTTSTAAIKSHVKECYDFTEGPLKRLSYTWNRDGMEHLKFKFRDGYTGGVTRIESKNHFRMELIDQGRVSTEPYALEKRLARDAKSYQTHPLKSEEGKEFMAHISRHITSSGLTQTNLFTGSEDSQ